MISRVRLTVLMYARQTERESVNIRNMIVCLMPRCKPTTGSQRKCWVPRPTAKLSVVQRTGAILPRQPYGQSCGRSRASRINLVSAACDAAASTVCFPTRARPVLPGRRALRNSAAAAHRLCLRNRHTELPTSWAPGSVCCRLLTLRRGGGQASRGSSRGSSRSGPVVRRAAADRLDDLADRGLVLHNLRHPTAHLAHLLVDCLYLRSELLRSLFLARRAQLGRVRLALAVQLPKGDFKPVALLALGFPCRL